MNQRKQDEQFMRQALIEAQRAFDKGEVPVGAVIVARNKIIARAHNLTQTLNDVTAHAEMQAFTMAAGFIGGKYLKDCILYVSLEPCVMCAGAAYWTQISRIVFAVHDAKRGYKLLNSTVLHPKTTVEYGIFEEESSMLLQKFFQNKRKL